MQAGMSWLASLLTSHLYVVLEYLINLQYFFIEVSFDAQSDMEPLTYSENYFHVSVTKLMLWTEPITRFGAN